MVGDFNAHMGNDEQGIKGSCNKMGTNGHAYRQMIGQNNLVLLNDSSECGGVWTRVQNRKGSVLDLTIVSESIQHGVLNMTMDENRYAIESKRAPADHRLAEVEIRVSLEKVERTKTVTSCDRHRWSDYTEALKEKLKDLEDRRNDGVVEYSSMETAILEASKTIKRKRKIEIGEGRGIWDIVMS